MTDELKDAQDSAVKPQVIDLDAADVTEVKDAASEPADPPPTPPPPPPPQQQRQASRRGTYGAVAALLLAGAVAGGWLYRDVLSSYFPSGAVTDLGNRMAALETNNKALQDQLAAMSQALDAARTSSASLDQSVKDLTGAFNGSGEKLAQFDQRLAATEKALAGAVNDLATLRNAVSAAGSGTGNPADAAALAALGQRLDALEKDVASLKSAAAPSGDSTAAAALSQALADLKAKIAAGSPYQAEFDRIARMVPAAPGLDVLGTYAALGLPAAPGLARELRDLIPALPTVAASAPPPSESSWWDSAWSTLTSIVTIRDIGETDWRALAEAAATTAEGGDLAGAIAAIDQAEGGKPAGLSQWRDRAAGRLALDKAVEDAAGAVLRQITALGGGQ
jgi:hypothetical protein